MAAKKSTAAMDFLIAALKRDPKASYADLKAKADAKKLKVYPIMYGRAQALLGIVKSAKRGQGKASKARRAAGGRTAGRQVDPTSKSGQIRELLATGMSAAEIAKKVGCTTGLVYVVKSNQGKPTKARAVRGPRKTTSGSMGGTGGLDGILAAVKESERERVAMRGALERIQAVIATALG